MSCDPACQKILANGRLMGPTTKRLLHNLTVGTPLHKAAQGLIAASEYVSDVVFILTDSGFLFNAEGLQWDGCAQASQIAGWARGPVNEIPANAANLMVGWAGEITAAADSLIKGSA